MWKSIGWFPLCFMLSLTIWGANTSYGQEVRPYGEMKVASEKYLSLYSSENDLATLRMKLTNRIESMKDDSGLTEEDAMGNFLLAWGLSNRNKLEQKDRPTMIQFCYYFVLFMEKGYRIPSMMECRMTPDKMQQLIQWLNSEVSNSSTVRVAMNK